MEQFDFDSLDAYSPAQEPLCAILVAPSGGGKSSAVGTLGVKTLYLHTSGETHGPAAAYATAKALLGDAAKGLITPVCFDRTLDKEKAPVSPDQAIKQLFDILKRPDLSTKYQAVAIDGCAELELLLKQTKAIKDYCLTDKGKHNKFLESEYTIIKLREMLEILLGHQAKGLHVVFTCTGVVTEEDGEGNAVDIAPKLNGYQVAEQFVMKFPEILVPARMTSPKTGKVEHRFVFKNINMEKVQKDQATGEVKKIAKMNPRVTGALLQDVPASVPADLREILKLKGYQV